MFLIVFGCSTLLNTFSDFLSLAVTLVFGNAFFIMTYIILLLSDKLDKI